jgi:hypothetical protein
MTPTIQQLMQKRVANISVGASTVRGQPSRTVEKAREYLQKIDLKDFIKVNGEDQFIEALDKHTINLQKELEELSSRANEHPSWGLARKVLNIFLFQAADSILLKGNGYDFDKIIFYLEVPLDNPNGKKLEGFAKDDGENLVWPKKIKLLDYKTSKAFQDYAKKYATREKHCARCYLDLYWWRG